MGLYDAAMDVANVLKKAGKIEEYQKILNLIDDLFLKREQIGKLTEENIHLKKQLEITNSYFFENNSYWHRENKSGPFCSRCFDKDKCLVRTIPTHLGSNVSSCPECKNTVNFTGRENPRPSLKFGKDSKFDRFSVI